VAAAASRYSSFLDRKDGAGWKEANLALQQVMQDYAGVDGVRSETLLNAGSTYLRRLRERALESLSVRNSHELMRALEPKISLCFWRITFMNILWVIK